ncbi:hypothetical protein JCM3774_001466 [Rhodotorula dairenensis]
MTGQYTDVYSEIVVDHNNVKDLYHRYKAASGKDERATLVNTIIREIALHSEAEEIGVYNVLESKGFAKESKEFRDEHEQLEKVLYSVDWTKIDDPDFASKFEQAIDLFIHHSNREEDDVLKSLKAQLTAEENSKLATDFVTKRTMVPSRPHPIAPQSGGILQKALGLQTKFHDKVVETLQGKSFIDASQLKWQHGQSGVEPIKIDASARTKA